MKYTISLFLISTLSFGSAEDLMAVCFSFTDTDKCQPTNSRVLLAQQGTRVEEEQQARRRLNTPCGAYCANWDTFCAEYMCDADTLGMTCDEIVADAKEHMREIATTVGTDECARQMDASILECMCVDQDD